MSIDDFSKKEKMGESLEKLDFDKCLDEVIARYPDLKEEIMVSLKVPQAGEYHNEGPNMEDHLRLMLENLNKVRLGRFSWSEVGDKEIEGIASDYLKESQNLRRMVDYIFLHDVAKGNKMQIKLAGEKDKVEISIDDNKLLQQDGAWVMDGKLVESVSYFGHGKAGGEMIRQIGGEEILSKTIEKHDIGYQMKNANVKSYKDNYAGFGAEESKLALVGLFIDLSASYNRENIADFDPLKAFYQSQKIFDSLQGYIVKAEGMNIKSGEIDRLIKENKPVDWEEFKKRVIIEKLALPAEIRNILGEEAQKLENDFGALLQKKGNEKALRGILLNKYKIKSDKADLVIEFINK